MITLDFKKLVENITKIPKKEEFDPAEGKELKKLFLVLAGDKRVIQKLTLEDMAELFGDAAALLSGYTNQLEYSFHKENLADYVNAVRRAV